MNIDMTDCPRTRSSNEFQTRGIATNADDSKDDSNQQKKTL